MNWGRSIVVAFILFATFIATLVAVCMKQDVNLVSKDYYRDELDYQKQIVRIKNANELKQQPSILKQGNFIAIQFEDLNKFTNGSLILFNPSDPKKDRLYTLDYTKNDRQLISIDDVPTGMYRVRMQWTMEEKEYFIETIINI